MKYLIIIATIIFITGLVYIAFIYFSMLEAKHEAERIERCLEIIEWRNNMDFEMIDCK